VCAVVNESRAFADEIIARPNTMPGLYSIIAHCADGGMLCADCVKENYARIASADEDCPDDSQWRIVALESSDMYEPGGCTCDNCNDEFNPADEDSEPEPDEDSLTTSDHRHFYQYGELVLTLDPDLSHEEMCADLRAFMKRENFFPDCFWISDHGNAHLINLSEQSA
jgi:hypothetical protein